MPKINQKHSVFGLRRVRYRIDGLTLSPVFHTQIPYAMVQLSAMPIPITVGDVATFAVPLRCHRFFNKNRRRVTADVNTALVEAECETGDTNH